MADYIFEKVIIAYTAGELLDQLEDTEDETVIRSEGGMWAGVSSFMIKTETFIDAFDHTVYQHDIYEPVSEGGENCFMLRRQETEPAGYSFLATAGDLKRYLKESVPQECTVVSADDNFELGGEITKGIKLLLVRSENGLVLDI